MRKKSLKALFNKVFRFIQQALDKLWTTFWNNGISNPLSVIEQISYLLFIKHLDDLELAKERKAQRLGEKLENTTFTASQQHIRWSHFKNIDDAETMLQIVRDEAFPFIKDLGQFCKDSTYAKHMKNAVFLLASPALLATVIEQIEKIPMEDRDTKGDLYLKCRMNAPATFFDKILSFAGDEIRPEYQPRSIGLIPPSVGKLCYT